MIGQFAEKNLKSEADLKQGKDSVAKMFKYIFPKLRFLLDKKLRTYR